MKKWIITILLTAALATLGATAPLWFPHVWRFLGAKSAELSRLTELAELLFYLSAGTAFLVRVILLVWRKPKPPPRTPLKEADAPVQPIPKPSEIAPLTVTSLHQLPPPPGDFTGREAELEELLDAVQEGGVTISGLRGPGGIGKTALALKLAEQLKDSYPDAQFYLDLKGTTEPLTPAQAMAHVIRGYQPEAKLSDDEAQLSGLYRSVLDGKRALLLMDNALDAEQVEPLIPPEGSILLVTSRQHFHLPNIFSKNLDIMSEGDARDLLLKIAPHIGDHADEIARLCGYFPLALRMAGSALAEHKTISPADYVKRLEKSSGAVDLVKPSLDLSYELLDRNMQRLWHMLAVFPGRFDTAGVAAVWKIPQEKAEDTLNTLISYSLVECEETTRRCHLHDLVRDLANTKSSESEREEARRRHAAHYEALLRAANEMYEQGGEAIVRGLQRFDTEWGNIKAGQAWAAEHAAESEPAAAKLCNDYADARYVLWLRLPPRERIAWLEAALEAARRLNDRRAEGIHLGDLGTACRHLGELRRAVQFYLQALEIAREVGDRRNEGIWLGDLGTACRHLGELRRAIQFYQQALEIAREIGDRGREGTNLGDLGTAYRHLGEPHRAIEYHDKALEITREVGDRRNEGIWLGCLGIAYRELGEPCRAIKYQEKALEIAREVRDRRNEGIWLGDLGIAYRHLDKPRRAIKYHEKALEIAREIDDRRNEGSWMGCLGAAYRDLGESRRAIEYHEKELEIACEVRDRRNEGISLGGLGEAYRDLGEPRRAIQYLEQQLEITREIGDRRGESNALFNISLALDELGKREKAIANAEAALEIFEQIEDPSAAKVREQLDEWRKGGR
ncbi:MAG: tetratricopeptide repeat protein [Armatimonadetes bacterium]|nr:tetratricopeptide repeat protein [Armatimonadota bacterium]NIM24235.1 tetratricopeptide repeat protein [Armatimonadota bacterium]NIM68104.1 tetratricopeptide repeat protein [Armatimonadota bacterium]NIM76566.1 tetratricopeptide repeat protein [Armatimonadota bacterium]NIN06309.1 tetratricopeptide repeat protein [Armatimonadota bacterium]